MATPAHPPAGPLVCPSCAESFGSHERFCPRCGVPLVRADAAGEQAKPSARQQHARKIKPQYAEGELVRVARAHHQAEAELIQGLLLEEGIPSMTRRSGGFDVPDFLAAGPRDVLVPSSGADAARDLLQPQPSGRGDAGEV
ncbi:MAG TPA: DUF2007 domain-containing protein [Conexibacter sp.]|jgi:hypothetical protein|nr:DUF2007 domain-containing protein [Conexibacter sp.]